MKNIISLLCVGCFLLAVGLGCNTRGNSYDTGFQTTEAEKKQEAEEKQILRELEQSDVFRFDGGLSDLSLSGNTLKVKNSAITFKDVQAFKERVILPPVLNTKGIKFIDFDNGRENWKVTTR